MARPLVIVESPAKAKTIARFLGGEFDVRASVGHVADLPSKGLAVDVDNGFKPTYELTPRGKDVVKELRLALRDASELYLATDEDREGEAISWHLLEALKPRVPVKRMVFHEITRDAIAEAVAHPRDIDYGLVDAAETRRILDRLYGYEVSPVLWRRVNRGLSAGRVQSPATRLVVERERERMAFRAAGYWDIDALMASEPVFTATLVAVDGTKVATGKDFDSLGRPAGQVVVLDESAARQLADGLEGRELTVRSVEERPYKSSPKAPFMTSTLQQEGGRKLRLSAAQVMRLAQGLYERGYITYMRTDATVLSSEAVGAARAAVASSYGERFLSPQPRAFTTKVKNAQEAHEAIRPTVPFRAPDQVAGELNSHELALYRLVWQRTLASQMADAAGFTVSVRLGALSAIGLDAEFAAAGTTITFPGYRQVYVESVDEGDEGADGDGQAEREGLLPKLAEGDRVPVTSYTPTGHSTQPPARYTEASLVKRLEGLGIGRPSTWASILQTILDRGYVWKKGQALVPTWTAFAVVNLLEKHFDELVDYAFTARMEDDLDAIARNEMAKETWLRDFYFGDDELVGLKQLVEGNLDEIDAAEINTFVARRRRQRRRDRRQAWALRALREAGRGHGERRPTTWRPTSSRSSSPSSSSPRRRGTCRSGCTTACPSTPRTGATGRTCSGATPAHPPPGETKPKMASLFKTMNLDRLTLDEAVQLLALPRVIGVDPTDGVEVTAQNGRYGPYVSKGKESRSLANEDQIFDDRARRGPRPPGPAPPVPRPGAGQAAAPRTGR